MINVDNKVQTEKEVRKETCYRFLYAISSTVHRTVVKQTKQKCVDKFAGKSTWLTLRECVLEVVQ